MEELLLEFVDTLDASLKRLQAEVGESTGLSKLTINQFRYIDAIFELGEPTITEIAERLDITKASVTAGINKLIQLGYVFKAQSTEDKRVVHVGLTAAGERLIGTKYQAVEEYVSFVTAALSDEEAKQFAAILRKLVARFRQTK